MTFAEAIGVSVGNSPFVKAFATVIGLLLAYPLYIVIYNVYFHPLAGFPGSKQWAATYIPYIYSLLRGELVQRELELHRRYGDVIRVGPNEISFAAEAAWRDIYEYRPGHKETIKDTTWYIAPNGAPQNIVTTTDHRVHARMRKYLGNSFTEEALKEQQPLIEDWINFLTVDIIGDLSFGESFGCLEQSSYHPWVRTLFNFLKGMVLAASTRFYPWVGVVMDKFLPKSIMEMQRKHTEFANDKINRRLSLSTNRPDFMTPFLKHNKDFQNMSIGEIQSTFSIIIVAGSETSATVLCGTLNHLTRYKEKLAALQEAIRGQFDHENQICIESTTNIPYLEAVIYEGLRLCNPAPGGLPRVVPPGGDTYAGHFLPGGTKLSVRPYIISRSPDHFNSPLEFHPERWLPADERPAQFAQDNLSASKPFSVGPTGCLGKPLAWAEMRLILAKLVWKFDVSADPDRMIEWTKLRAMMTVEKVPMPLRLKERTI